MAAMALLLMLMLLMLSNKIEALPVGAMSVTQRIGNALYSYPVPKADPVVAGPSRWQDESNGAANAHLLVSPGPVTVSHSHFGLDSAESSSNQMLDSVVASISLTGRDPGLNVTVVRHVLPSGQLVTGYLAVVANPVHHFGIFPAPNSRDEHIFTGVTRYHCTTASPEVTSLHNACLFATNAGFFNMDTGQCIGNLVHKGRILQVEGQPHKAAQFGVDKSGKLVAGYLTTNDLMANQLEELITGKGWLVRNATSFINQSIAIEHIEEHFVTEKAPRTGVGWDEQGRLMIFQVDGEEDIKTGCDLFEFADLFVALGAFNAVNLDGGGSSVTVHNGRVISRPTCDDTPRICVRAVTTVTCVY